MKQLINYCKRLYSHEALQMAIDAFREDFHISFEAETSDAYQITLKAEEDLEVTTGEFDNYVIRLENRSGLGL